MSKPAITALREIDYSLKAGRVCLVLKCKYTEQAHNNSFERIFLFGSCCAGPERPLYTSRESKSQ